MKWLRAILTVLREMGEIRVCELYVDEAEMGRLIRLKMSRPDYRPCGFDR
jgi:hypothetical protein